MIHELKTWPEFFAALVAGNKTFEIRKDDRGFSVGDVLILREWDPETQSYTGWSAKRRVRYLLTGWGLEPGYVCMGLDNHHD